MARGYTEPRRHSRPGRATAFSRAGKVNCAWTYVTVQLCINILWAYRSVPRQLIGGSFLATYVLGRDVRTHCYRIIIAGGLGEIGREAFKDFSIVPNGTNTVLIGNLDQSALHGALNRMLALGLELVELNRLSDGAA